MLIDLTENTPVRGSLARGTVSVAPAGSVERKLATATA